ncbi:MAG: MYXO-CTERM sorting domain-containing protein, partial [Myxococcota bacterium]
LASQTPTEADIAPATIVFTLADWFVPRTVTVTGVDDAAVDGDQPFTIAVTGLSSADPDYDDPLAFGPLEVTGITRDDDGAGYVVVPSGNLVVTEAGSTATFLVSLLSQPTNDVIVVANTDDPTEGLATPSVLTFSPSNFATPQAVTVTGVDDTDVDGDVGFTIVLAATTADPVYSTLDPPDVTVTTIDDDQLVDTGSTGDTGAPPTPTGDTGSPTPTGDTGSGDTAAPVDTGDGPRDTGEGPKESEGCGCQTPTGGVAWLPVVALLAVALRRRRVTPRR